MFLRERPDSLESMRGRHKVKNGTWVQGRVWRKAPDGRIFVNIYEFERWVESDQQPTAH